jgi:hypothetical protein
MALIQRVSRPPILEGSLPMTNRSDDHDLTTADAHHLRRYIIRAAKAYLCVVCWFGLCAGFLAYGPPAMSVPSAPPHPSGIVAVIFGVGLSAGTATVLTIVLAVSVVALIDRQRSQSAGEQDETDATTLFTVTEEDTQ